MNGGLVSENERQFILSGLKDAQKPIRADGRELLQHRKLRLQFRRSQGQSQAELQLGRTRVLATVSTQVVPPFPDRPTEGFLQFNVDLSPMANPLFSQTSSRRTPLSLDLTRSLEKALRESKALDTEALTIVAGEQVWSLSVNITIMDDNGNLLDACMLATSASLLHCRLPSSTSNSNQSESLPLSVHHLPYCITFGYFQASQLADEDVQVLVDPVASEEELVDGQIRFVLNSFREVCTVQKNGGSALSQASVIHFARIAASKVEELGAYVVEQEKEADVVAVEKQRQLLRGQQYRDVALGGQATDEHDVDQELADYDALHRPIPLREEVQVQDDGASIQDLMKELESAANKEDKDDDPGAALTQEAREDFEKLTQHQGLRGLIRETKSMDVDSEEEEEQVTSTLQSEFGKSEEQK